MEPEKVDYNSIVKKIAETRVDPDTTTTGQPLEQQPSQESSKRALSLWMASQVPERHLEFKPEDSLSEEWNNKWCELSQAIGFGTLGVIIGTRGAGKTQMSICAIRQTCKALNQALYSKVIDFFLEVRSTYRPESKIIEKDVIDKYCKPFLLVIDAVENRSDSPFENMLLNYLIDKRYDQCKDTILIGNFTEAEFAASMGPSIVDRIHECGIKIMCTWNSFRRLPKQ